MRLTLFVVAATIYRILHECSCFIEFIKRVGLPSILSLFHNKFNKFNDTGARMLDSIYHMTNILKSHFRRNNVILLSLQ